MHRLLPAGLVFVLATGCVSQTYQIPHSELERLAQTAPEQRGQQVRVVQDLSTADDPPDSPPVNDGTVIVVVPVIEVDAGGGYDRGGPRPVGPAPGPMPPRGGNGTTTGGGGTNNIGGGHADDAKAQAIAYLAIAATAAIVLAATEGERYDGWVQVHPMMPVHLWGPGGYTVVPLAQIDANTAAWAERAVIRPTEGPWRELGRAPLDRVGLTYSMLLGMSDVVSKGGTVDAGAGGHIMIGGYATHMIGVLADFDFAWAANSVQQLNLAARASLELDVLPIDLGPLHAGLYGELGYVHRTEDGIQNADASGLRAEGGGLVQLAVNTRLALTARLGLGAELGERIRDITFGLSIF
jgi:hypothetical protein